MLPGAMTKPPHDSLVVFSLDDQQFALNVSAVERVVRAVEVTPLPGAPAGVCGVVDLHGAIIPVFDLRAHFGQPSREVRPEDHLVIARTARRKVALLADAALGVVSASGQEVVPAAEILPGLDAIEGVMKLDGGIVLIHDLDRFLRIAEDDALVSALQP